jgi:hypothetical protein
VLEFNLLFTELNVGLRGRVRLSDLEVGMLAGWGQTSTVVQGDNEPFLNNPAQTDPGLFPDMEYTYLRFGVDARAPVMDELSIGGGLSVRLPELGDETGQIAEQRWFPRATATGLDAQLFGLYRLTGGLSAMALVDARFYWMTMHSNAGDIGVSAIAGGAQDRYIGALLGLEYVF